MGSHGVAGKGAGWDGFCLGRLRRRLEGKGGKEHTLLLLGGKRLKGMREKRAS